MRKFFSLLFLSLLLFCGSFVVHAATVDVGLQEASAVGLGTQDIRVTIAGIIRTFMGILGILAVIITLIGGFIWMTAGGAEEKISQAKKILLGGVIGLVITLSAYSIASFVLNSLATATGLQQGAVINNFGAGGPVGGPPAGVPGGAFFVRSITPQGDILARNVVVRVLFSDPVNAATVDTISVKTAEGDVAVPGRWVTEGSVVSFTPSSNCPAPNQNLYCFAENTEFKVTLGNGVKGVDGRVLYCGVGSPCLARFSVGSVIDQLPPSITWMSPSDHSSVAQSASVELLALAQDDGGVSRVDFYADNALVGSDANAGGALQQFSGRSLWNTQALALGSVHALYAQALDVDNHVTRSSTVNVTVRAQHCFNGQKDEDEINVDCGGAQCGACAGGACQKDADCQRGICQNNICVETPLINNISPRDGAVGSLVTIQGSNFGRSTGEVTFLGGAGDADDVKVSNYQCNNVNGWSDTQVVVEVPSNAKTGPVRLVEKSTGRNFFDTTADALGGQFDFVVNNVVRPGLCLVDSIKGEPLTAVTLRGKNLQTSGVVTFGGIPARSVGGWTPDVINNAVVPQIAGGLVPVVAKVNNIESNNVLFSVVDVANKPSISYVYPTAGPVGQFVTVYGSNLGNTEGKVEFVHPQYGVKIADINVPQACRQNYWRNDQIVVKVPAIPANELGNYSIRVTTASGLESAGTNFLTNNSALQPGLCLISPANGGANTVVTLVGQGFGSAQGRVRFFENQQAQVTSWADDQIKASVPGVAKTGPLLMVSNAGVLSNSLQFEINDCRTGKACGAGFDCCRDGGCLPAGTCQDKAALSYYRWNFSTGVVPKPLEVVSYFPNCTQACRNAIIGAFFTDAVDEGTLSAVNVELYRCTNGQPCTTRQNIAIEQIEYRQDQQGGYEVDVYPQGNLDATVWYRVVLRDGIRSQSGAVLQNLNFDRDNNQSLDSFSWVFQVKAGDALCEIKTVDVQPESYVSLKKAEVIDYTVYAQAAPDVCDPRGQKIDARDYSWTWNSSVAAVASIIPALPNAPFQKVNTLNQGMTNISASTMNHQDAGQLDVDLKIPEISDVSPKDGLVQSKDITTAITIKGKNFGAQKNAAREVIFNNGKKAVAGVAGNCFSWTDDEILVQVPFDPMFQRGEKLTVTVKTERGQDTWDGFTMNDFIRPSICKVEPSFGKGGDAVTIQGINFGDVKPDNSKLEFGTILGQRQLLEATTTSWSNLSLLAGVPGNINTVRDIRPYGSVADALVTLLSNHESNSKYFLLEPFITSLTPATGPVDTWMTITGGNFGEDPGQQGSVIFKDLAGQDVIVSHQNNFGLPGYCGDTWSDAQIVVKVPAQAVSGLVKVRTQAGLVTSDANSRGFILDTTKQVGPGICVLDPNQGPVTSTVDVKGDNLGTGVGNGDVVVLPNSQLTKAQVQGWDERLVTLQIPTMPTGNIVVRKQISIQTGRRCANGVLIGEQCVGGQFVPIIENQLVDSNPLLFKVINNQIPDTCGDGVWQQQAEECDKSDVNSVNRNACNNACQLWGQNGQGFCGDGVPQMLNGVGQEEDCDLDGANIDDVAQCANGECCTTQCRLVSPDPGICGDDVQNPGEECDGDNNGADICDAQCQVVHNNCINPVCGNGVKEQCPARGYNEACDEGAQNGGALCTLDCKVPATCLAGQQVCGQNCCGVGDQCVVNPPAAQYCQAGAACFAQGLNYCALDGNCCPVACVQGGCPAHVTVTPTQPLDGANGICRNVMITATTDKVIDVGSLQNKVFLTKNADNSAVALTVAYDEVAQEIQITPNQILDANQSYTVIVHSGVKGVDGSQVLVPVSWDFVTKAEICTIQKVVVNMHPQSLSCQKNENLVLSYNFEEPANAVTVLDQTVNALHAPIKNQGVNPVRVDAGSSNKALSTYTNADGTSVYVDVGKRSGLDASEFTVDLWINPRTYPANGSRATLIWNGDVAPANDYFRMEVLSQGQVQAYAADINSAVVSNQVVPLNQWSHITMTIKDTALKIYIDGVLVGQKTNGVYYHNPGNAYLAIGSRYNGSVLNPAPNVGFDGLIDDVKIYAKAMTQTEITECTADLFSCASDSCPKDVNAMMAGNQHRYSASALDRDRQEVVADFHWSELDETDILDVLDIGKQEPQKYVTSKPKNGTSNIIVQAVGKTPASGSADVSLTVDVLLCKNPWSFSDEVGNIALSYCADRGTDAIDDDLPLLIKSVISTPPQQNAWRGFLFKGARDTDVVGLLLFSNTDHLNPLDWYRRNVPNAGNPAPIKVAGYEALQDGRSTYVFAANVTDNGQFYTNVYVFSYTDTASADLTTLMAQILANVRFNINIPGVSAKAQIIRDTKRLADIQFIQERLNSYAQSHGGQYPALESGSFIPGVSYSTWPSWSALGSVLGVTLPVDPINKFNACVGYADQNTCWDPIKNPKFANPGGLIYSYGNGVVAGQQEFNP